MTCPVFFLVQFGPVLLFGVLCLLFLMSDISNKNEPTHIWYMFLLKMDHLCVVHFGSLKFSVVHFQFATPLVQFKNTLKHQTIRKPDRDKIRYHYMNLVIIQYLLPNNINIHNVNPIDLFKQKPHPAKQKKAKPNPKKCNPKK